MAPIWFIGAALVIVFLISACTDYAKKEKERIRERCQDSMYAIRHFEMCQDVD